MPLSIFRRASRINPSQRYRTVQGDTGAANRLKLENWTFGTGRAYQMQLVDAIYASWQLQALHTREPLTRTDEVKGRGRCHRLFFEHFPIA